jgi:RsiW-degrading membrane proteinase PrsW (M82 family)
MGGEVMSSPAELTVAETQAKPAPTAIERRIRISAVLLIVGLAIEAITLHWAHPTAFLVFMFIGGTFMGAGILLFLYSLVSTDRSS